MIYHLNKDNESTAIGHALLVIRLPDNPIFYCCFIKNSMKKESNLTIALFRIITKKVSQNVFFSKIYGELSCRN